MLCGWGLKAGMVFVSDIAVFVLEKDVKLQQTNRRYGLFAGKTLCTVENACGT